MHQAVDGTFGWGFDVDQPVMGANFKVFSRVLIDERTTEDTETANPGRERHRAGNLRARALDRIDNFGCRRVQAAVVKGPKLDPNAR